MDNYRMPQQPGFAPALQLKTNRNLVKFILLSLITLGIYGIVVMTSVSTDINYIAGRYDGKKTMHFCLLFFVITPITLGIGTMVWYHRISERIDKELRRRNINYIFDAASYWLWAVLGSLLIAGPFVYLYKLFKAMNLLSADYNARG